ncbi:zinc-binding dehydrogenase [Streptomyces sp. NBC_00080]|uniref:zinc-binding dehydrogenase n=1 Tax=Streptomyces sp. NBC_00080 TaxID=2975645 RepID=UPI00324FFA1C
MSRVREIAPQGVDAVYDIAGQGALPDSIELRGAERIITIADPTGTSLAIPLSTAMATDGDRILAEAARTAIDGKLRIVIAADLPLADAAKAMAQSETGHAQGKIVLHP